MDDIGGTSKNNELIDNRIILGETVIHARDYIYDEAGNITNITASNGTDISNLTSAEMAYDAANRLIKYNGEEVKYDADGNMIYGPLNGEMSEFVYDCRNRLVSAGGVTYEYDAENNRISKTAGETKTEYVIDTSNTLSHVLTATTGDTTTHYVYGIGLLYQEEDGETLFYHFNNIGSTEALTDESGQVVEIFAYGPYGELLSENKCGIMYLYNGEYGVATDENGLYYMRARYYNSEIKRFVNQDVLIGTISDSPTMNRYAYVNGNPISLADPFGLSPSINWSSVGHTALSWLGLLTFVPGFQVVGIAANAINAIWYFKEGNAFDGICSMLCALPGLGNVIGKIGTVGSKTASISESIANSLHIISNVGFVATGFYSIGEIGYNNWQRYVVAGENYTLQQVGADLLTGFFVLLSVYGGTKSLGLDKVEVPTTINVAESTSIKTPIRVNGSIYIGGGKVAQNPLPNYKNAFIKPTKLTGYALNPEHPVGKNKARVFESVLGYNLSNADELMEQIYRKLPISESALGEFDSYGQRYTVDMMITGPNGNTAKVRTGWIIKPESQIPELTTLYVKE